MHFGEYMLYTLYTRMIRLHDSLARQLNGYSDRVFVAYVTALW